VSIFNVYGPDADNTLFGLNVTDAELVNRRRRQRANVTHGTNE